MSATERNTPPEAWWLQYPAVKSTPKRRDAAYLEELMKSSEATHGVHFAVIDVRGTDRAGGQVKDSINYRAQEFYPQVDAFGERFKTVPEVFFYCGSSNGRGPRVAGWYQDWLDANGIASSKALILDGGMKVWVERNGTDHSLTQECDMEAAASTK